MDIKIIVAAHKNYWFPDDEIYFPLHVGKAGKKSFGLPGDDTGENISARNEFYSELTGLYWAWKNLSCEYLGLCHYRRYFGHKNFFSSPEERKKKIFSRRDYEKLLRDADIILPTKRNYYIETVREQYEHAHGEKDLPAVENLIGELYPDLSKNFSEVMSRKKLHLWNMFVMRKEIADEYFSFLFDVLFRYEEQVDAEGRRDEKFRRFGYISERLLDVWLCGKNFRVVEADVINLEKINWIKKGGEFLKRKFFSG